MIRDEFSKFLIIYEEQSLSRAADRLDVYQGSLSKLLGKLEYELNTILFNRSNRGMIPTQEGQHLYNQIIEQTNLWDGFLNKDTRGENELTGRLRVGAHSSVMIQFTKALTKLHSHLPKVEVEYVFARSPQVTRRILNHELDIAFVVNPLMFQELVVQKIKKETVGLFSTTKRPPKTIFYNSELISSLQILKEIKKNTPLLVPIQNYNIAAKMAKESHQAAILPESAARRFGLTQQIGKPFFIAEIALIYRADHRKNKILRKALEVLKD